MSANKFHNALEEFNNSLFRYLVNDDYVKCLLTKRHTEKLQTHGEYSFVNTRVAWVEFLDLTDLDSCTDETLLDVRNIKHEDIIEESKKWCLSIEKVKVEKDRVYLFLDRSKAVRVGLSEALSLHKVLSQRVHKGFSSVRKDPKCSYSLEPTYLRLNYLMAAIRNLCAVCLNGSTIITVTCKSSTKDGFKGFLVHCNNVLNAKTGAKEKNINSEEFIKMRQTEMSLIAQHKYGVRVGKEEKWKAFIENLGESAVIFEMLQIKYSNPIRINFENIASGSSKGASFVLYNCARLETMLKTFNEKVEDGTYPQLPEFDAIDVTTLTDQDEWILIFTYIMGLPHLLNECVELKPKRWKYDIHTCEFRPHLICNFLSSMVRTFSQYYRRVRILTEPRAHMLPVLFARIYMLRSLHDTLKICLKILNIKSVTQM